MQGIWWANRPISLQPEGQADFRAICGVAKSGKAHSLALDFAPCISSRKSACATPAYLRTSSKARAGNLGDVRPVGEGVFEIRSFFGPGWRMYYVQRDGAIIFMLGGGDKSSQTKDIEQAHRRAKELDTP